MRRKRRTALTSTITQSSTIKSSWWRQGAKCLVHRDCATNNLSNDALCLRRQRLVRLGQCGTTILVLFFVVFVFFVVPFRAHLMFLLVSLTLIVVIHLRLLSLVRIDMPRPVNVRTSITEPSVSTVTAPS